MDGIGVLTLICCAGCGLIAGVFFVFSVAVMKALSKLPPTYGIAAMQSINVVILNPWFLSAFLGTALACLIAMVVSVAQWDTRSSWWNLAGGLSYLAGTFVVTIACNVPRNNTLARVDAESHEAVRVWRDYVATWTAWNHVRTLAALVASILFAVNRW